MSTSLAAQGANKTGFRQLKVIKKVRESSTIASFYLEPTEQDGWRNFQPGQYLVFRFPARDGQGFVLRNYSVSCSPESSSQYRITVKREAAPATDLPNGLSSCYLHDEVTEGDVLVAEGPRGEFVLDRDSDRPVVLLSGGVGLTPLVSMLHSLALQSERRVCFIHACDNGEVHALRDEVETLAASRPDVTAHFCYRFPTKEDKELRRHHSEGVVSRELLQSLLPLDDYDFYLCGPAPFMQAVYSTLRSLSVPKQRIAYEFFGPATLLETVTEKVAQVATTPSAPVDMATGQTTVEFRRSRQKAVWDSSAESLLAFAEEQGLEPDFSCRAGICGSCKSHLVAGEVTYFEEPLYELEAGEVLLCCSKPRGAVILDI